MRNLGPTHPVVAPFKCLNFRFFPLLRFALAALSLLFSTGCAVRWSDGDRDYAVGTLFWSEKSGPGGNIHEIASAGILIDLVSQRLAVGLNVHQELETQWVKNTEKTWASLVNHPPKPDDRTASHGLFWNARKCSKDPILLHESNIGAYAGKSYPIGGLFLGFVDAHSIINVDANDSCLIIGPRDANNMNDTFAYRGTP